MVVIAILLVIEAPVLPIAVLAILATCGSAFFYPAMGAYVPNLVTDERQLGPANSAWSSLDNLSFILGPAIGGLLLAFGFMHAGLRPERADLPGCRLRLVGSAAVLERRHGRRDVDGAGAGATRAGE